MATNTTVGVTYRVYDQSRAGTKAFQRSINSTTMALKRMASNALVMAGAYLGARGLYRGIKSVVSAAMEQERVEIELSKALKTTGEYTSGTMNRFKEFAAGIQRATIYGDEEVLSLMRLISSLGVSTDSMEHATKVSIGLAAATNRDVQSMAQYVALAQQGEFTMLRRYIPALRATTDKTEQLRIVNKFAARGFEIAKAEAESTAGALKQLKNATGDLKEAMGKELLPVITNTAQEITRLVQEEGLAKDFAEFVRYQVEGFIMIYESVGLVERGIKGIGKAIKELPEIDITKRAQKILAEPGAIEKFKYERAEEASRLVKAAKEFRNNSLKGLETKAAGLPPAEMELTIQFYGLTKEAEEANKKQVLVAEEAKKIAADRIAAVAKIYGEMGRMSEKSYIAQKQLLNMQAEDYKRLGIDIVTIEKWKNEQIRNAQIKLGRDSDNFFKGAKAAYDEMEHDRLKLGQAGYQAAYSAKDAWVGAFQNMIVEGQNWRDAMRGFINDVGRAMQLLAAQMVAESLFFDVAKPLLGGIIGGLFSGGAAAATRASTQGLMSPQTINFEPGAWGKQHGGIVRGPGLAYIEPGIDEAFVPLHGGRSIPVEVNRRSAGRDVSTNIHIHNESMQKLEISKAEEYFLSDQRIINVVVTNAESGGKTARMIQNVVKRG